MESRTATPEFIKHCESLQGKTVDITGIGDDRWRDHFGVKAGKVYRQNFGNGVWGAPLLEVLDQSNEFICGSPIAYLESVEPATRGVLSIKVTAVMEVNVKEWAEEYNINQGGDQQSNDWAVLRDVRQYMKTYLAEPNDALKGRDVR